MSKFEKKWWFIAPVSLVSTMLTMLLMHSAGMWPAKGMAQWTVYFFCLLGVWKSMSFLAWLTILFAWPSSKALD